ncbi:hypothetical protein [Streptomyces kronopolitis]|uniref:hypothetical protein n=1 Tax=Streptomyces kronopolitis TaxID=1612435 RepID=UPI001665707A|nr:hypothetical protein [Streptomyces kronopolitis]
MPEINQPLFQRIHDPIPPHPEGHDQTTWGNGCGTVHCVAGWVITFGTDYGIEGIIRGPHAQDTRTAGPGPGAAEVAAELLGLTKREVDQLYAAALVERYALKGRTHD